MADGGHKKLSFVASWPARAEAAAAASRPPCGADPWTPRPPRQEQQSRRQQPRRLHKGATADLEDKVCQMEEVETQLARQAWKAQQELSERASHLRAAEASEELDQKLAGMTSHVGHLAPGDGSGSREGVQGKKWPGAST